MRMVRTIEEAVPAAVGCEDVRCGCGSLLARYMDGAVELKCRRCKSVWRLPIEPEAPRAAARAAGAAGPGSAG